MVQLEQMLSVLVFPPPPTYPPDRFPDPESNSDSACVSQWQFSTVDCVTPESERQSASQHLAQSLAHSRHTVPPILEWSQTHPLSHWFTVLWLHSPRAPISSFSADSLNWWSFQVTGAEAINTWFHESLTKSTLLPASAPFDSSSHQTPVGRPVLPQWRPWFWWCATPILSQLLRCVFPTFLKLGPTKTEVAMGQKRSGKKKGKLFLADPIWSRGLTMHELRPLMGST